MKVWLAAVNKSQLTYELTERETVCVAFDAATGGPSEFIGKRLDGNPQLT